MFLNLFPVWVVCAAVSGFLFPEQLTVLRTWIVPLLTGVMLCMGLTLKLDDFLKIRAYKWALLAGIILQFSVMPIVALMISLLFKLGPELTIGMVLVGSVAGGTASNVMTMLAGGNVALSVSMTAISTLLSIVMTPLLLLLLIGSTVEVQAAGMLVNLFKIVLLPVALGVLLNHFFSNKIDGFHSELASLSVVLIAIIIAVVVALNQSRIESGAMLLVFATLMHNLAGLSLGYMAAYMLGFDRIICRTIAIEVGMQNSGLATVLAVKFFSPLSALPGAIFSIWLNITGSIFARLSVQRDRRLAAKS